MRVLHIGMALTLFLAGCGSMAEKGDAFQGSSAERDRIVAAITQERMAIEARKSELTKKEVSTEKLNERIKQKWSKLDFYSENGTLIRIKTYPHASISTRTEEFYFRDGKLMLAYIEDEGTQSESGGAHATGKEYYYDNGRFVAERDMSGEKERSIRHSDEERLEAEAIEYQGIFKSMN